MRTRGDKRPSCKNDRKVLMAEESTKSWADTDSDSSSSSSSSNDSEQEEVHCLLANQTSDDELSHSFEEIKAEKENLKNSSIESSTNTLEDIDSLKIELTCTRRSDEIGADGFSSSRLAGTNSGEEAAAAAARLLRREEGRQPSLGLGFSVVYQVYD
ncbi:hypothetical protein F511_29629 [Dorcoceras hygrometricum]|uniref:Uncharacterized protein n=1 Tax=Dorcoceras hygrometricum TaxID=472368 RepID=A0A2Z7CE29_9LAMI|nr:hypothetical protein F511_29629 [Dorcoceras hygrometricum]